MGLIKNELLDIAAHYRAYGENWGRKMRNQLTTREVAERGQVNPQTIRYYEREGLLPKVPRLASGYRAFPSNTVGRVRFIKRAQKQGFSLKEVRELLDLWEAPGATRAEVKQRAKAKMAEIDQSIRSLRQMKSALAKLTTACDEKGPAGTCPILEAFQDGGEGCADQLGLLDL